MKFTFTSLSTIIVALLSSSAILAAPADTGKDAADTTCKGHTSKDKVGQPFEHPSICNQFYTCSEDGKAYVGNCPAGTYYDIALTTCTAAAKSSCGKRKA
ncbi:hypothetical protein IW140_005656 [Coemansia sp. RSA 1813]|nr:hypothetical protein EV178_005248 [Coemansia sp. RSA 1646]KAJ1767773.1 hypothetical protein LPJ74_005201 [Coemansia sp. RSA 1843]KAJ2087081.1 hypothetical protein IW138_005238 [Coemansia sp. RSA 986]KAJ2212803.1 hypothetical protein EV179_004370 [Coemansia sp. RSA 487]KAJ2564631.1 hypothetical protein IW140_005656 [Coemansia sp. RSA 1813]